MPRAAVDLSNNTIRFTDGDPGGIAGQLARISEAWAQAVPRIQDLRMQQEDREYRRGQDALSMKMQQDQQAYSRGRDTIGDTRYDQQAKWRQEDQDAQRRTEWANEYRDLDTHIGEAQRRRMSDIALRREAVAAARAGRSPKQFDPALYGQEITKGNAALGEPVVKSHGLNPARAKELDSLIYSARASGNQDLLRQIQAAYPDAHASAMLAAFPEGNEVSDEALAASDYGVAPMNLSASEKAYLMRYIQDPRTAKYLGPDALRDYRQMYDGGPVQQDVVTGISGMMMPEPEAAAPAPPAAPAEVVDTSIRDVPLASAKPNATQVAQTIFPPPQSNPPRQVAPAPKPPNHLMVGNVLRMLDDSAAWQRENAKTAWVGRGINPLPPQPAEVSQALKVQAVHTAAQVMARVPALAGTAAMIQEELRRATPERLEALLATIAQPQFRNLFTAPQQ